MSNLTFKIVMAFVVAVSAISIVWTVHWFATTPGKSATPEDRAANISYVVDKKTGLCFAFYKLANAGGLTRVPCEALK